MPAETKTVAKVTAAAAAGPDNPKAVKAMSTLPVVTTMKVTKAAVRAALTASAINQSSKLLK